jgi:hypothetical protein
MKTIPIPFSASFSKNHDKGSRGKQDAMYCIICGKYLSITNHKLWVTVVDGGGKLAVESTLSEDDMTDYGFIGAYPIGKDCLRKHPELKEYLVGVERKED